MLLFILVTVERVTQLCRDIFYGEKNNTKTDLDKFLQDFKETTVNNNVTRQTCCKRKAILQSCLIKD